MILLPAGIGVREDKNCLYWLHTHEEVGIIHIESPIEQDFTLGQFFDIWGKPLNATQAGELKASEGMLRYYVDGQEFSGDARSIILKPHQLLTVESGKDVPPPGFTFPSGL